LSFGLINFVNLSTTFFIQGFLFFIKEVFLSFFFLGSTFFYICVIKCTQ